MLVLYQPQGYREEVVLQRRVVVVVEVEVEDETKAGFTTGSITQLLVRRAMSGGSR